MPPVHHPFASKAQWRMFFANPRLRQYARDKAHATQAKGGYKPLPRRKGAPSFAGLARKVMSR